MRPSLDEYLMALAEVAATRTTCIRRGVGCTLADKQGHVLAIGYNGVARGMHHCNEIVEVPVFHNDPRVKVNEMSMTFDFQGEQTAIRGFDFRNNPRFKQCVGFDQATPHACKDHADKEAGKNSCEAVHAEINALLQCSDVWKIRTAYSTSSPCKPCLKALINTGCQRIVFRREHSDPWPKEQWLKLGRSWEQLK